MQFLSSSTPTPRDWARCAPTSRAPIRNGRIYRPPRRRLSSSQGVDRYISPSSVSSQARDWEGRADVELPHRASSGPAQIIKDSAWLRMQIEALTRKNKSERAAPWAVGDAPDDFLAAQIRQIVGHRDRDRRRQGKVEGESEPQGRRPGQRDRRLARRTRSRAAEMAGIIRGISGPI